MRRFRGVIAVFAALRIEMHAEDIEKPLPAADVALAQLVEVPGQIVPIAVSDPIGQRAP